MDGLRRPTRPGVAAAMVAAVALVAAGADWPQWRGPNRNDVTPESSGWPTGWPPRRLWTKQVGAGCTSPIIVAGRLYVMGWSGSGGGGRRGARQGADTLYCLSALDGKELWKQSCPCPYQSRLKTGDEGAYGGPSSTPTFDPQTALLYTLSIDGDLRCWDTRQAGRVVWASNLHETFPIRQRPDAGEGRRDYGHTSAPLIHGEQLIVEVGSAEGTVMGFDKKTGRRVWASEFREPAGHSSGPVPMKVAGADCIASLGLFRLVVMRLDAGHVGQTVATAAWQTDFANNIPTPAVHGSAVVLTSSYNVSRTALVDIAPGAPSKTRWTNPNHSGVCSPVIYKGRVFFADGPLRCLDLAGGASIWRGGNLGHGSCLVAAGDDKLIAFGNGQLVLVDAMDKAQCRELARVRNIVRGTCYPHVALSDGILCCKDRDGAMVVFSVRPGQRSGQAAADEPEPPAPKRSAPPAGEGTDTARLHDAPSPKLADAWPGSRAGLVFLWDRASSTNQVIGPDGKVVLDCRLTPRGRARPDSQGAMDLAGGAMLARDADEPLLKACQATHQLAIEATIASADLRQSGPARILSFSTDPYHRNFTLGQEGGKLLLRLRTPRTGENGSNPEVALCTLKDTRPHHLIVSYSPGRLTCYLDGRRVLDSEAVGGDFSNWTAQHLLFGDEWRDDRDWSGTLRGVAIHNRVIGAAEAAARCELARKLRRERI